VIHWPRQHEPFAGDDALLERIAADVLGGRSLGWTRRSESSSSGGIGPTGGGVAN
jgi:hypothetical protein